MVNYIPNRYDEWVKGKIYGINKTLVFVNPLPGYLNMVDWDMLEYDYVGFWGNSDPFWDIYKADLNTVVEKVETSEVKKLVLVTKLPKSKRELKSLFYGTKKVQIVVSITGVEKPVEQISTEDRVRMVYDIADLGLTPLVLIHPYIHTLSNLNFLRELSSIKNNIYISRKGFRYHHDSMKTWAEKLIDKDILNKYKKNEQKEILIGEDKILSELKKNGLLEKAVNFREFVHFYNTPRIYQDKSTALKFVERLLSVSVVSSSSDAENVFKYAVKRRTEIP